MINNISLDSLKVFYEVAKQKSITKAADRLYISQPAVTQSTNKLEELFGVKLLNRTRKGVSLTAVGEEIFGRVNSAMLELGLIDEILFRDKELKSGKISIGCASNVARKILLGPLDKFLKNYPSINISQIEEPQRNMLDKLRLGEIDICISQQNELVAHGLNFKKLFHERFVFVCGKKYSEIYKKSGNINFIVQGEGSYNRQVFDEFISKNKVSTGQLIQIVGYNMAIELAIRNLGIAIVPQYIVEEYIKDKRLFEVKLNYNSPIINYGYYINPSNVSSALSEFLKFLI